MVRAALLSAALLLPALPTHAQTPIVQPATEEPSMEVMKSFGCLATGTGGTVAAIGFGPENLVNLVSGGIVTPANSAVLAIGVVGVVFASFCAVGESLTPGILYMADRAGPAATRIADATVAAVTATAEVTATAVRATATTLAETVTPAVNAADAALAAASAGLDTVVTATQRLATAALATAAEALDATASLAPSRWAPSAWADTGWNALAELCLQSPLCRARVAGPSSPARDIASR